MRRLRAPSPPGSRKGGRLSLRGTRDSSRQLLPGAGRPPRSLPELATPTWPPAPPPAFSRELLRGAQSSYPHWGPHPTRASGGSRATPSGLSWALP